MAYSIIYADSQGYKSTTAHLSAMCIYTGIYLRQKTKNPHFEHERITVIKVYSSKHELYILDHIFQGSFYANIY